MQRLLAAAALTVLLVLLAGSPARAQGLPTSAMLGVPQNFGTGPIGWVNCGGCIAVQSVAPVGATYSSPYVGTITEWAANISGSGDASLVVLRPVPGQPNAYTIVSVSASHPVGPGANTYQFATSQPVQVGDLVGMTVTGDAGVMTVSTTSGSIGTGFLTANGIVMVTPAGDDSALWFRATVVRTPVITGIAPDDGPSTGGTAVTISGQNFDTVTSVLFDGTPAQSFTVNGFSSITAVAPPGAAGPVSISVAGATGTSVASTGSSFTYTAPPAPAPAPPPAPAPEPVPAKRCVVPHLKGSTLDEARRQLRRRNCRLGSVARQAPRRGRRATRIVAQYPHPGHRRATGTHIRVTLGFLRR